jgi:hypothetical protein
VADARLRDVVLAMTATRATGARAVLSDPGQDALAVLWALAELDDIASIETALQQPHPAVSPVDDAARRFLGALSRAAEDPRAMSLVDSATSMLEAMGGAV